MQKNNENLHLGSINITVHPDSKEEPSEVKDFFSVIAFYQSDKVIVEKYSKPISKILTFDI
ncbi:hypothetical protein D3C87_679730 [compost metagenome]